MNDWTRPARALTHAAGLRMLEAGIAEATRMGVPQCIVIVDASGETLASIRMDGAKFLSMRSATAKARTSASIRAPSGSISEAVRLAIAAATDNAVTGLPGGLPIIMDGETLGGIGVGSGKGDEDVAVARAALSAIGARSDF